MQTDDSNTIVLAPNKSNQITVNVAAAANADVVFNGTAAITLPSGNTAAQPSSPVAGMQRYNSQTTQDEHYQGSAWRAIGDVSSTQTYTNKTLTGNTAVNLISGSGTLVLNTAGTATVANLTGTAVVTTRTDVATSATIAAVSSTGTFIRLTGSTATSIQGIVAGSAGVGLTVYNVSSALVSITHQNGSATAANRIITPSGLTVDLQPQWSATFYYDDSQSRWILTQVSSVQEWKAYTPTYSAGFGTVTSNSAFFKIIGDSLFIRGSCNAGTVAASVASISIPTGFTISSAKLSVTNNTSNPGNIIGEFANNNAGAAGWIVTAPSTSTSVVYFGSIFNTAGQITPQNGNDILNSSQTVVWQLEVPIV